MASEGVKKCIRCGRPVAERNPFCSSCGALARADGAVSVQDARRLADVLRKDVLPVIREECSQEAAGAFLGLLQLVAGMDARISALEGAARGDLGEWAGIPAGGAR